MAQAPSTTKQTVKAAAEQKINLETIDAQGRTTLHRLVQNKSPNPLLRIKAILKPLSLPQRHQHLNRCDFQGNSVLFTALQQDNPALTTYLIEQGASTQTINHAGNTLIHQAVLHNAVQSLQILLKQPGILPSLSACNNKQQTPYMLALAQDHLPISLQLLELAQPHFPRFCLTQLPQQDNTLIKLLNEADSLVMQNKRIEAKQRYQQVHAQAKTPLGQILVAQKLGEGYLYNNNDKQHQHQTWIKQCYPTPYLALEKAHALLQANKTPQAHATYEKLLLIATQQKALPLQIVSIEGLAACYLQKQQYRPAALLYNSALALYRHQLPAVRLHHNTTSDEQHLYQQLAKLEQAFTKTLLTSLKHKQAFTKTLLASLKHKQAPPTLHTLVQRITNHRHTLQQHRKALHKELDNEQRSTRKILQDWTAQAKALLTHITSISRP